jgi:hypothetical protein
MAATYTTLASACGRDDQQINVTSATGFAVGNVITVDGEQMVQTAAAVGTIIAVQRGGKNGGVQSAHPILASVVTSLPTDVPGPQPGFTNNPAPYKKAIVSYGASGAITPPTFDTIIFLDKATAAAMTLTSPTGATPDGTEVTIYSNTAAAHTITYTPGFNGDTTSSDVATFAATIGNSITLLSARGLWGVKCAAGVTLG